MPVHLWLTPERRALLSSLSTAPATAAPAWFKHLRDAARAPSPYADSPGQSSQDGAATLALRAFLDQDPALAARALADWRSGLASLDKQPDLGKAHLGLTAAVLLELASPLWSPADHAAWRSSALDLAASFFHLSPGNPHHVANNWWAVTHSGLHCLAAALHASGSSDHLPAAARSIPEIEEWAWARLDAFLGHFGDAGAYHEGLGYQDYTCSFLLPAALLHEHRSGESIPRRFPGLARMAALLFASGIDGPAFNDSAGRREGWGRQLSWNDAGLGWSSSAVPLLALAWASPSDRAALLPLWTRLSGHLRPAASPPPTRFAALFFALAFHPADTPSAAAAQPALSICDRKQGLWFSRDGYLGPRDAVLGAYARCHHPGGHSQNDAGSFRFSALGWDWVLGGGQARPEALWQSVVVSSDAPPKPACGSILHVSDRVFGMELRAVHAGYGERHLALHPARGRSPLALAVLDLIDDHRSDRDWAWRLTTSPEHAYAPAPDGLGFTLTAPDGATLVARFLGEPPLSLDLDQSPGSARTYANGVTTRYGSRPCVVARFARRPALALYIVLTVRPAGTPPASPALVPGAGLSVAWGGDASTTWSRPFGLALPANIPPSRLRGQSPHPAPLST
jgi:hypothetical protein